MKGARKIAGLLCIIVAGLIIFAGCQPFHEEPVQEIEPPPPAPKEIAPLPLPALAPSTSPVYYDFKDVLIPGELTLDSKRRSVYKDARVVAGILVFDGRVESGSLATFFEEKMPRDGWRPISTFQYQKDYLITFQKDEAFCQITIYDNPFTTQVEIRRSPLLRPSDPMVKGSITGPVAPPPPAEKDITPKPPAINTKPLR
jgi:hypothetical protein